MILLQATIALGFLLFMVLIILVIALIVVVFVRSDNQIIGFTKKRIRLSLKQKIKVILKNLFYYLMFTLPVLAIIYGLLKDIVIM